MFRIFRRFASRAPATPMEAALRLLADGRAVEAVQALTRIAADPASSPGLRAQALDKRGVANVALGDFDDARADFQAALTHQPGLAIAHVNLGNLELEAGRTPSAIERYRTAVALDAECALAHFNLGIALKKSGRYAEGVRSLRAARRIQARAAWTRRW